MATRWYPAIIEKAKDGFGVWFPDIDGCVTHGDTIDDAVQRASEVLAFWFEDANAIPAESSFEEATAKAKATDVVMLIPARTPEKVERINVSLTDSTIALADQLAQDFGTTRSGLIAKLIHEERTRRLLALDESGRFINLKSEAPPTGKFVAVTQTHLHGYAFNTVSDQRDVSVITIKSGQTVVIRDRDVAVQGDPQSALASYNISIAGRNELMRDPITGQLLTINKDRSRDKIERGKKT